MDVIVLAGGFAKRMWPLTKDMPKQLLPVAGRPMLDHTIRPILAMRELERLFVSTNERFSGQFREFLDGYGDERIELFVEPSHGEEQKLGAIGGLGYLIRERGLSRDTMIVGGDNLFEFTPSEPLEFFRSRNKDIVAVYDVGSLDRAKLYGIVDVDREGVIVDLLEKPDNPPSTLAATAFYMFKAETIGLVNPYLKGGGKRDALGHFISYLVREKEVLAWSFSGKWFDVGSLEVYREADEYFSAS
ncbi:MAG: nucleotidyltransferase family protein [Candidatus Thermoplasmatota archaeon]|nr:nucleotidyltransferase family protein [Candidatus Thermoplasmatota archaeon]